MKDQGEALLKMAMRFLDAPFRLQGRDPATGLDCIGLLAASLAAIGRRVAVPSGYTLHWDETDAIDRAAERACLIAATRRILPGDVLLLRAGPAQLHLMIAAHRGMAIHAHAGLRRVVLSPLPGDWPTIRHWRLAQQ